MKKVVLSLLATGVAIVLATSCVRDKDYSHCKGELGLQRYDSLLMRGGGGEALMRTDSLFAELWTRLFGYEENENFAEFLSSFAEDSAMQQVQDTIFRIFQTTKKIDRQLCEGFSNLKREIPYVEIPRIHYFNGGFNAAFMMDSGMLGIALDRFLGSQSTYYQQLAIPRYALPSMEPARIAPDAVKGWLEGMYPPPYSCNSVIDRMLYFGKLLYISETVLPSVKREYNLSFSKEELDWLKKYEKDMWQTLSEQQVLFSTDPLIVAQLTNPGPFTRAFGDQSPGRAGIWIGYRIISNYMKNERGTTLSQLFATHNSQQILAAAKYNP